MCIFSNDVLAKEPKICKNDQEMMQVLICVAISEWIKMQTRYIKTTYLTRPLKPALYCVSADWDWRGEDAVGEQIWSALAPAPIFTHLTNRGVLLMLRPISTEALST